MEINKLNLSARAKSSLISAGFISLEDLRGITDAELRSIKNVDEDQASEIRLLLQDRVIVQSNKVPGTVYFVSETISHKIGCYRLEAAMVSGRGEFNFVGIADSKTEKESKLVSSFFFRANCKKLLRRAGFEEFDYSTYDYLISYQDLFHVGVTDVLTLPTIVSLCSNVRERY